MSVSHEQAERLIHLLEENIRTMSALSDATAALTTATDALTTAVASVPASGSDSAEIAALQQQVTDLQGDIDAAIPAVQSATTAVTDATSTLTTDEAPATPPPAPVPDALNFPTQAIDVEQGGTVNSTVTADGGTPPYSFSSSSLPEGLSINGEGVITGPAPAEASSTGTVDVTDSLGATASGTVEFTLTAPVTPAG